MPGALRSGLFFSCFFAGTVLRGGRQYSEIPLVLGVLSEGTKLFAPTYVLESDAIMGLNACDGFYPQFRQFPLMLNQKVGCVFPAYRISTS